MREHTRSESEGERTPFRRSLARTARALAGGFAVALQPSLRSKASSAHLKQLVKKVGQEQAEAMLKKAEEGFKENYQLLKKLAEM